MTYARTSQEPFQPAAPNALIKGRAREVRGATSAEEPSPEASAAPTVQLEMQEEKPTFQGGKLDNDRDRNIKN